MLIEGVAALVFECGSGPLWAGFAGYDASHAEFPLVVGRTQMLGILVSMDQKDRYAFSGCSHAHCVQRQVPWLWCAENCGISAVAVFQVVDTPFVTQRCIPMVLVIMEIPQLRLDMVVDGPLLQVVQFPVVTPRLIPMVQTVCRTTETLQLLHTVFNALLCRACWSSTSRSWCRGLFPWSCLSGRP